MFESRGGNIAHNGKSICEGRAKLDEKFNFDLSEANAFFRGTKLQKKCGTKKQARLNATGSSIITSTPPFANTMLCEVATFPFIFRYLEQFHFFVIILYFSIKIHSIFQRNIFRIFVFGYNY